MRPPKIETYISTVINKSYFKVGDSSQMYYDTNKNKLQ